MLQGFEASQPALLAAMHTIKELAERTIEMLDRISPQGANLIELCDNAPQCLFERAQDARAAIGGSATTLPASLDSLNAAVKAAEEALFVATPLTMPLRDALRASHHVKALQTLLLVDDEPVAHLALFELAHTADSSTTSAAHLTAMAMSLSTEIRAAAEAVCASPRAAVASKDTLPCRTTLEGAIRRLLTMPQLPTTPASVSPLTVLDGEASLASALTVVHGALSNTQPSATRVAAALLEVESASAQFQRAVAAHVGAGRLPPLRANANTPAFSWASPPKWGVFARSLSATSAAFVGAGWEQVRDGLWRARLQFNASFAFSMVSTCSEVCRHCQAARSVVPL